MTKKKSLQGGAVGCQALKERKRDQKQEKETTQRSRSKKEKFLSRSCHPNTEKKLSRGGGSSRLSKTRVEKQRKRSPPTELEYSYHKEPIEEKGLGLRLGNGKKEKVTNVSRDLIIF